MKERFLILIVVLLLIAIGAIMIYSSSSIYAGEKYNDTSYFLKRHLMWVFIGICFLTIGTMIDYNYFLKYSKWSIAIGMLLLVATYFVGKKVGGAKRWLSVAGFAFQPSEIVKIAIIAYIADFLSRKQDSIKSFFQGFVPVAFTLAVVCGLILVQPDLGSVVLIAAVSFCMFFLGGIRISYLLGAFLCSVPLLYEFIFKVAYRRKRIMSFLNPWDDPQGISFQIVQSFIALGGGGIAGVGLGQSKQKLFYLPEAHTDFIFSIIGEELGFIGCSIIILLFVSLFVLGFMSAYKIDNLKGHLFSLGIIVMVFLQALINIGVVSGTLPTKGLPLPFISFGGTNLIMLMFSMGILLNISRVEERSRVAVTQRKNKKVSYRAAGFHFNQER